MRSGAAVQQFSAWRGATVQRFAAPDAAPWPDAAAAEPDGRPVRPAAPLPEAMRDGPWRGVVRGEPWRGMARGGPRRAVVQDEPWREAVPRVGPRPQAVRAFLAPGQTSPRSPQPSKRQEEML